MHRWIAFFDFDGTITSEETFYGSMLRLNPQALEKERRAFIGGEVKLRDGLLRIFSGTPSDKFALIEDYIKGVPLRSGFRELLVYLKSKNIPTVVISGGVTQLIDIALAPHRELITDVYSVYLDLSGEHMRHVSEYDDGEDLMPKPAVMDRYSYENAICIGDGITDAQMAQRSTLVFARDDLRVICDKEHLPYTAWDDFFDVLEALKKYGISND
jgi:2-hydroxy-3-keto-5-methylthiopentenyl-1-phosphate phosphatase